jgi:small redox-active disulfide protein 2
MLTIKVYGPGCANCRKLEEIATKALADAGLEGEVLKVTDMPGIVAAGVLKTPGLSAPESVLQWIREAAVN